MLFQVLVIVSGIIPVLLCRLIYDPKFTTLMHPEDFTSLTWTLKGRSEALAVIQLYSGAHIVEIGPLR